MIAFTLCSNNYLAQAKVLADSIHYHNPECKVFIGLVDELSDKIDYNYFRPAEILPLKNLNLQVFDFIINEYGIIELNTCVKPSFFKYLKAKYPDSQMIYYFDPDIKIYNSLQWLNEELANQSAVVTPHFCSPIPLDGFQPGENLALNYGTYNLGFIGVNTNSSEVSSFLDWWEERCLKLGYIKPCEGLFVDQLWINLAPVFFKDVKVLNHPGLNMAPWNLHERQIERVGCDNVQLTGNHYLFFYHFSSYSFDNSDQLSKYYNRFSFSQFPLLRQLYDQYRTDVFRNDYAKFSKIPCVYGKKIDNRIYKRIVRKIERMIKA